MNKLIKYLTITMMVVYSTVLSSCYDEPVEPEPEPEAKPLYMRIYIGIDGFGSRAAVANGYDYEAAVRNEDKIDNLTLFFYSNVPGPDSDVYFYGSLYISRQPDDIVPGPDGSVCYYYEELATALQPGDGDRMIVVTNMGDRRNIRNMAQLRAATAQAFRSQAQLSEYDRFAMSTCDKSGTSGIITLKEDTNGNDFFSVNATVERLAARFDLWLDRENIGTGCLEYTATNGRDKVYITDVALLNAMQQPGYVLKHTSKGFDMTDTEVCGYEYLGDDGLPTNYVVEPTSLLKGTGDALEAWYGGSRATLAANALRPISDFLSDNLTTPTTGAHNTALTIGYAAENTYTPGQATAAHVTGVALRAVYVPEGMNYGDDFWRVRHVSLNRAMELYFDTADKAAEYVSSHPDYLPALHYPGGVGYYTVWFRHRLEKNSEEIIYPMEFGTVRNHIYRMAFSFSTPGSPELDIHNPEQHIAQLYVRRWNFKRLQTIIM